MHYQLTIIQYYTIIYTGGRSGLAESEREGPSTSEVCLSTDVRVVHGRRDGKIIISHLLNCCMYLAHVLMLFIIQINLIRCILLYNSLFSQSFLFISRICYNFLQWETIACTAQSTLS